jgi:hypothetical protein
VHPTTGEMMRFDTELQDLQDCIEKWQAIQNPMVQTSRRIKYEKPRIGVFCGFNRGTLYFETIIIGSQ